jgi:transmembrane sensor
MLDPIRPVLSDPEFLRVASLNFREEEWEVYLARSDRKEDVWKARFVYEASSQFPKESLSEKKKASIWLRIDDRIARGNSLGAKTRFRLSWLGWAAAAILFAIGSFLLTPQGPVETALDSDASTGVSPSGRIQIVNDKNRVLPVPLLDGSTVLLAPNSRLSYDESLYGTAGVREVWLEGEAFFEVVSNAQVPFYVFANELATKVIGTSFNIKSFPLDGRAEVVVHTGKVKVFLPLSTESKTESEGNGLLLSASERVVLDKASHSFASDRVSAENLVGEHSDYSFDDEPVSEVFARLEQSYGIVIRYPLENLEGCRITALLNDEPLYEKIRLICLGLNASYELVEGEIVISSDGCL